MELKIKPNRECQACVKAKVPQLIALTQQALSFLISFQR
jgi:hypothetical protein